MGWSCATEAWIRVNLINLRWGPYAASEWRGKALRPAWTFLKALHKGRVSNTLWDQRDQLWLPTQVNNADGITSGGNQFKVNEHGVILGNVGTGGSVDVSRHHHSH